MSLYNTNYGDQTISVMLQSAKSLFFLGIGGVNMSSLAHIASLLGFRVGGSDRTPGELTRRLEREGLDIHYGHQASSIDGYDALVYTLAIAEDNPEYTAARERGIPCISRADFMGYLMRHYGMRIGISGMHGKSTCTSMVAHALTEGGLDPTVLSGAVLNEMQGTYRIGSRNCMVFEACEYKDSFLSFYPRLAVVLNMEMDHVDYFKSMDQIRRSFASFLDRTDANGGMALVNADDENTAAMLALRKEKRPVLTFGLSESADYRGANLICEGGLYRFDLIRRGGFLCKISLSVPGRHNVYNALACAAVCDICGMEPDKVAAALADFHGAERRLEYKGQWQGATVYDDFAHHPTEINATLDALRAMNPRRLLCIYQPHTFSRTAELFDGYVEALAKADQVYLADIYAARETNTYGVSIEALAEAIRRAGTAAEAVGTREALVARLKDEIRPGDFLAVLGAGDIGRIYPLMNLPQ